MCHKNQTKRHYKILLNVRMFRLMVFNATFNHISWRKPPTCRKSLTNLSHNVVSSTPHNELGLNSQL